MNIDGKYVYMAYMLLTLLIAGAAEYLKIAPPSTFYTVFVLIIGLIAPSPAFPHAPVVAVDSTAIQANTDATQKNTAATQAAVAVSNVKG